MRRVLIALALAACDSVPRAGPGLPGGPPAPVAASPMGRPRTLSIGPAGDSFTFTGTSGALTLTVPPGAVASPIDFTIDEVTPNTAPSSIGSAFRVGPSSAALLAPVTLAFTPLDPGQVPLAAASHQIAAGYWFRSYDAARDATTVSTRTTALGDWTLVSLATAQDLHGPVRIDSTTQDVPFTATGDVVLQSIGAEPGFSYYIPTGTLAPSSPGCDPVAATALPLSIADLRTSVTPNEFYWGLNGQWTLTCGTAHPFITAGFDSMGIDNPHCSMGYSTALPVDVGPDHLRGQFVIDCGPARGKVIASWDLVLPAQTPGALPPP